MKPLERESAFTVADARRYLAERAELQPGMKILYGHPSPRYWRPETAPLSRLLAAARPEKDLVLYLHIPFCPRTEPGACGFCTFPRQDLGSYDEVSGYVDDLLKDLRRHARLLGRRRLASVYVGGGTPNVLSPDDIRRLFAAVRESFDVTPSTEINFEGYPSLFTDERLRAAAEAGVTRISVGVQVLEPRLLRHSGRAHSPGRIRRTIEFCRERGLQCSADLITGWFEQEPEDVAADVETLASWGVTDLINHPIGLQGDTPFSRERRKLPSVDSMRRAFLLARERLLSLGFRADGYTDYRRPELPPAAYLSAYRNVLTSDRVGVGYGAHSLLAGTVEEPGLTYSNVVGLPEYRERAASEDGCAGAGFRFSPEDLKLLYVTKGLEGEPYLDAGAYAARFESSLREDFAPVWDAVAELGWLDWPEGAGPRLKGDGIFFTALVQRCVVEARNRELRSVLAAR